MTESNTGINPDQARELLKERENSFPSNERQDIFSSALSEMKNEDNQAPRQPIQHPRPNMPPNMVNDAPSPLGRINNTTERASYDLGWKALPTDYLPSAGMFYPLNTLIQIRAASVREIRQFSTIDDRDPLGADDKLKFIIENCCMIKFEDRPGADYKDLLELDRLYILLAIRELTFSKGENKLQMNSTCGSCQTVNLVDIEKHNIKFLDFDERLKKYYNSSKRCFTFQTKEGDVIDIYLPSIGVSKFLTNYARNRITQNLELDEAFLNFAPFIFSDWRSLTEKTYKQMSEKTFGWSIEMLSTVTGIIDVIRNSINVEVQSQCKSCGAEVTAPISFPGGTKSLFLYSDPFSNLV